MGRKRAKRRASTGTCLSTRDKDNSAPHRSSQRVCPIRTLPPWDTIAGRRRHGEGEAAMDDLLAEYRRATDAFESGDPVRAARMLEPIVAAEPSRSDVRLLLARAYYHSAQLVRAEEQLRVLIEQDPSDHYAQFVLGRTLERRNQPERALPHLRPAVAMHPIEEYTQALRRVVERLH